MVAAGDFIHISGRLISMKISNWVRRAIGFYFFCGVFLCPTSSKGQSSKCSFSIQNYSPFVCSVLCLYHILLLTDRRYKPHFLHRGLKSPWALRGLISWSTWSTCSGAVRGAGLSAVDGGDGSWKSEPFQPTICLWVKLVATKENMSPCGDRAFIDCIYRTLLYCSIAVGIFSQYVDA